MIACFARRSATARVIRVSCSTDQGDVWPRRVRARSNSCSLSYVALKRVSRAASSRHHKQAARASPLTDVPHKTNQPRRLPARAQTDAPEEPVRPVAPWSIGIYWTKRTNRMQTGPLGEIPEESEETLLPMPGWDAVRRRRRHQASFNPPSLPHASELRTCPILRRLASSASLPRLSPKSSASARKPSLSG